MNLGPAHILYKNREDALRNPPGEGYELIPLPGQEGIGVEWWVWRHRLQNPYEVLLARIERIERVLEEMNGRV